MRALLFRKMSLAVRRMYPELPIEDTARSQGTTLKVPRHYDIFFFN